MRGLLSTARVGVGVGGGGQRERVDADGVEVCRWGSLGQWLAAAAAGPGACKPGGRDDVRLCSQLSCSQWAIRSSPQVEAAGRAAARSSWQ